VGDPRIQVSNLNVGYPIQDRVGDTTGHDLPVDPQVRLTEPPRGLGLGEPDNGAISSHSDTPHIR
jgi:hypothetical protein